MNTVTANVGDVVEFADGYYPDGKSRPYRKGKVLEKFGNHDGPGHSPRFARIEWQDDFSLEIVTLHAIRKH